MYWLLIISDRDACCYQSQAKIDRTPEVFISVAVSCDSPGDHKPCNHTHSAYSQRPWCTSSPVLLKAFASSTSTGDGWGRNEGAHSKFPVEHFLAACRTPRNFVSVLIWNIRCAIWVFPLGAEMVMVTGCWNSAQLCQLRDEKHSLSVRNTVGGSPI